MAKFAQKGLFLSDKEKLNIIIEFRIFKLVLMPYFPQIKRSLLSKALSPSISMFSLLAVHVLRSFHTILHVTAKEEAILPVGSCFWGHSWLFRVVLACSWLLRLIPAVVLACCSLFGVNIYFFYKRRLLFSKGAVLFLIWNINTKTLKIFYLHMFDIFWKSLGMVKVCSINNNRNACFCRVVLDLFCL